MDADADGSGAADDAELGAADGADGSEGGDEEDAPLFARAEAIHRAFFQGGVGALRGALQRGSGEPLLARLDWRHDQREVRAAEGELVLRESPFDPVADLPVRRLVGMEYEEGTTQSNGRVLRALPAEWVLPVLHQRYDEPGVEGIEV